MRSAGCMAGWLVAVLVVAGCGPEEKPAGTFDEADVQAFLEQWRDALQKADRERLCALRGSNFVMFYTREPPLPGYPPGRGELDRERLCRYGSLLPKHRLDLLAATITMTGDGKGANVVADFRQTFQGSTKTIDLHLVFVLGEEAGKLVSLREDFTERHVDSGQ